MKTSTGRRLLDPFFARAQEKGLQFGQTRSHAIIVHDSVLADCNEKVVSQGGYKTLHRRLSTRRPALKITLKDVCKLRQQQQQETLRSTGSPVAEQSHGTQRSTGKLVAEEEENPFKVDLRSQGIPQDAEIEDRETMSNIQELVDMLRTGYQTESVINDLGKTGKFNTFSEATSTSRELYELGDFQNRSMPSVLKNTNLRDYFIAHVVYALCPRGNRKERFKLNLRLCLSRSFL